nr:uncharacterized protein LOC112792496 [Arachis hypogaea]
MHIPVSWRGFPTIPVSSSSTFPLALLCATQTLPLPSSWFAFPPFSCCSNFIFCLWKLEERDLFLCGSSISFCKKLIQFGTKYRKKFGFGFITSTDIFLSYQILEEVKV